MKKDAYLYDLAAANLRTATEVCVGGKTQNLHLLASNKLDRFEARSIDQAWFDRVMAMINPVELDIYGFKVTDLSALRRLSRLRWLAVEWNTKLTTFSEIGRLANLEYLALRDIPKATDLESLSGLKNLKHLTIAGSIPTSYRVPSLAGVASLTNLESLTLSNVRVADASLRPLAELRGLKQLALTNRFPTEEYAWLSVKLPDTECLEFAPWYKFEKWSGKNIMITGSRKPFLDQVKDVERIRKYEREFAELQRRFREHDA